MFKFIIDNCLYEYQFPSIYTGLSPLPTILTKNKLHAENYVDWKYNLDIMLMVINKNDFS